MGLPRLPVPVEVVELFGFAPGFAIGVVEVGDLAQIVRVQSKIEKLEVGTDAIRMHGFGDNNMAGKEVPLEDHLRRRPSCRSFRS
jgi:hypothetical protein